jgi:hypothetical protein
MIAVSLPVTVVSSTKAFRHEILDLAADDLLVRVSKECGHLLAGKSDDAGGVDDDYRIGCRIEDATAEVG